MSRSESAIVHNPGRLVRQFDHLPNKEHSSAWSQLWDEGASDLWDRGCPSPSLVDLLEQRRDIFNPLTTEGTRKIALVPGCGRGYDVALLALHGYDAYGLEVSPAAVAAGAEYITSELANPSPMYFSTKNEDEITAYVEDKGKAHTFRADFFEKDWAGKIAPSHYDLVYDYTFFCALPLDMRQQWGERMSELLHPGGQLVCLEFPLYKNPSIQGPPWGVGGGVYWDTLVLGGTGILKEPIPQELQDAQCNDSRGMFVRTLFCKPQRSHVAGKGTDMVSVWSRK